MTEHDDRLPMHQMLENAREAVLVTVLERVLAGEPD
jgi:hypothetical protein